MLRRPPVLEVVVVRLDLERQRKSFKVVLPCLQSANDGKHLFVVDLVVPFSMLEQAKIVVRVKQ